VLGAILLALGAQQVGELFDGIGQDLVNIAVLSVALAMLLWHCIWVSAHAREMVAQARQLGISVQQGQRTPWALLIAVALAVLREGAETVLFVGGALTGSAAVQPGQVMSACAIGVLLGVGAGAVIYGGLSRLPAKQVFATTNALIAILAGSIASQLAKSLTQAGFLERGTAPLWDTSTALAPDSALGTLLHALMGYDARPSAAQLASYGAVLLAIYAGTRLMRRPGRSRPQPAAA
jgi:high-affinity iron transporter